MTLDELVESDSQDWNDKAAKSLLLSCVGLSFTWRYTYEGRDFWKDVAIGCARVAYKEAEDTTRTLHEG